LTAVVTAVIDAVALRARLHESPVVVIALVEAIVRDAHH
jgi:hypothetical protein